MQELLKELTGKNLKQKRLNALLTQQELAEKIGVSKVTVIQWEMSKNAPSLKHLRTLKAFFNQGEK